MTYRLRFRGAQLLGAKRGGRTALAEMVKNVYGSRSKIVHTGATWITSDQLSEARTLAVRAILQVIHDRRFTNVADLEKWFQQRAFG